MVAEVDYRSMDGKVSETFMVDFLASDDEVKMSRRRELFVDRNSPYTVLSATSTS